MWVDRRGGGLGAVSRSATGTSDGTITRATSGGRSAGTGGGGGGGSRGNEFGGFVGSEGTGRNAITVTVATLIVIVMVVMGVVIKLLIGEFPSLRLSLASGGSFTLRSSAVSCISRLSGSIAMGVLVTGRSFRDRNACFMRTRGVLGGVTDGSSNGVGVGCISLASGPSFASSCPGIS